MKYRIRLWALAGIAVACGWVVVGLLAGLDYNPGQSMAAAITAPVSLLGRRMPLGVVWFVLLNGALYALVGAMLESLRRLRSAR